MKFTFFGAARSRKAAGKPRPQDTAKTAQPRQKPIAEAKNGKAAKPLASGKLSPFAESLGKLPKPPKAKVASSTASQVEKLNKLQSLTRIANIVSAEVDRLQDPTAPRLPSDYKGRLGRLQKKSAELSGQIKDLEKQTRKADPQGRQATTPKGLQTLKADAKIVSAELKELLNVSGPRTPSEERRLGRLQQKSAKLTNQIKAHEGRTRTPSAGGLPQQPSSGAFRSTAKSLQTKPKILRGDHAELASVSQQARQLSYAQSKPSGAQFAALDPGKVWDDVPRDGNCLFHTIAAVRPELEGHETVRAIVATAVGSFSDDDIALIDYSSSAQELEQRFAKNGNFQIDNMVGAAAKALGMNINVVTDSGETVKFRQNDQSAEPDLVVALAHQHYFRQVSPEDARNPVPS